MLLLDCGIKTNKMYRKQDKQCWICRYSTVNRHMLLCNACYISLSLLPAEGLRKAYCSRLMNKKSRESGREKKGEGERVNPVVGWLTEEEDEKNAKFNTAQVLFL